MIRGDRRVDIALCSLVYGEGVPATEPTICAADVLQILDDVAKKRWDGLGFYSKWRVRIEFDGFDWKGSIEERGVDQWLSRALSGYPTFEECLSNLLLSLMAVRPPDR